MEGIILDPLAVVNTSGQTINPATDETVVLLRRLVKLLESQAVVDSANRQKVTIDSTSGNALYLGGQGLAAAGNVLTVAAPVNGTTYPFYTFEGPVEQRWRVMEDSHQAYQLGIRSHLSFI